MEQKYTLQSALDSLIKGKSRIQFTKVNGESRTMNCTLDETYLPEKKNLESESVRKQNKDTLCVWSLDDKQWKSFRIANLIDIEKING